MPAFSSVYQYVYVFPAVKVLVLFNPSSEHLSPPAFPSQTPGDSMPGLRFLVLILIYFSSCHTGFHNHINNILFLSFIYLFWERQRQHELGRGREREKHRIRSRFQAVSTEPDAGLELTNHEIMTWAKIKSQVFNRLSHTGTSASQAFSIISIISFLGIPFRQFFSLITSPLLICEILVT